MSGNARARPGAEPASSPARGGRAPAGRKRTHREGSARPLQQRVRRSSRYGAFLDSLDAKRATCCFPSRAPSPSSRRHPRAPRRARARRLHPASRHCRRGGHVAGGREPRGRHARAGQRLRRDGADRARHLHGDGAGDAAGRRLVRGARGFPRRWSRKRIPRPCALQHAVTLALAAKLATLNAQMLACAAPEDRPAASRGPRSARRRARTRRPSLRRRPFLPQLAALRALSADGDRRARRGAPPTLELPRGHGVFSSGGPRDAPSSSSAAPWRSSCARGVERRIAVIGPGPAAWVTSACCASRALDARLRARSERAARVSRGRVSTRPTSARRAPRRACATRCRRTCWLPWRAPTAR